VPQLLHRHPPHHPHRHQEGHPQDEEVLMSGDNIGGP
jgi:hypothetical protein